MKITMTYRPNPTLRWRAGQKINDATTEQLAQYIEHIKAVYAKHKATGVESEYRVHADGKMVFTTI